MIAKDHTFSSERLTYRGIARDDAETIVAWRSRPENYRTFFADRPITLEEHLRWFEAYLADETRFDFMIVDADGRSIGTASLSHVGSETCEVSYLIGEEDARGKGFATEAVRAMCDLAAGELGATSIEARIRPENEPSAHVALAAGFTEEERVFRLHM